MELVQSRIVTNNVEGLAAFYAGLVGTSVALNEYYVEVPAGAMSVGFSKRRFTEYRERQAARPGSPEPRDEIILDFVVDDRLRAASRPAAATLEAPCARQRRAAPEARSPGRARVPTQLAARGY